MARSLLRSFHPIDTSKSVSIVIQQELHRAVRSPKMVSVTLPLWEHGRGYTLVSTETFWGEGIIAGFDSLTKSAAIKKEPARYISRFSKLIFPDMTTSNNTLIRTNKRHWTILFASSLFITLLLFYVDEGYYNFSWMSRIGNWIPFIVYAAAIFSGQLLFSKLLLKKYHGPGKTLLSVLGGAAIGILVVIFGIFTSW